MSIGFIRKTLVVCSGVALAAACSGPGGGGASSDGVDTGRGVDPEEQVIRIAGLYDLSGPLASIGVPWEAAATSAIDEVNDSGRLGDWTIEYVTRDHSFNPSNSVSQYDEVKDDVLMISPSLGTQPTAPLLPRFAADDMLAFVGGGASTSLTSHSIWGFNTYHDEGARAVDHAVEAKGDDLRLGILYTDDDSGADALQGTRAAAEALDVEIVEEVTVEATTDDFSAAVGRLERADATDVVLATGAGLASGAVGTASARDYKPQWYGILPSFVEAAWYGTLEPEAWEDNFYWVHGLPYWGEDRPGMEEFLDLYEESAAAEDFPGPQVWALIGHLQIQQMVGILEDAIDAGDLTPEGVYQAADTIEGYDADGMLLGPVSPLGEDATRQTRILEPDVANQTWDVVGDVKELDY
ncbi:ABC transporter substrate-binding protein [Aeromicrobium sp. CTD01-1L150]|uniref:ABC transporter substrate-binding protein n=1 Tax=Aeromicrobium sp. CTD01-1L150 TaxID=3341830 RepID=UPI0035C0FE3A